MVIGLPDVPTAVKVSTVVVVPAVNFTERPASILKSVKEFVVPVRIRLKASVVLSHMSPNVLLPPENVMSPVNTPINRMEDPVASNVSPVVVPPFHTVPVAPVTVHVPVPNVMDLVFAPVYVKFGPFTSNTSASNVPSVRVNVRVFSAPEKSKSLSNVHPPPTPLNVKDRLH
jgi:hypothetical protein